jgi:hypothetical protein
MKHNRTLFVVFLSLVVLFSFKGEAADTIAWVDTPGNAFAVHVSGSYAYVADDYAGLTVINVADAQNPTIVGSLDTPGYTHALTVSSGYAYLADTSGGFRIADVSIPNSPSLVGSLMLGDSVEGLFISGATAYLAAKGMGLQIVDITNPANPTILGRAYTVDHTDTRGVCVVGSKAYIADGKWGLRVVDVTKPKSPKIVGSVDTPGTALNVSVLGSYAYVADLTGGLQVIDISNDTQPTIVASVATKGYGRALYIFYPYVYLADDHAGGLRAIDITDPLHPAEKAKILTPGNVFGVYVAGNNAYVADYGTFRIIDIGVLMNRIVSAVATPGNALDVNVSSPYAYVADDSSGLQVINVSNPLSPYLFASAATPGSARGVQVSASYAYVADGPGGLQIINLDNPQNPNIVGYLDTNGTTEGVFVAEPYAYVAEGDAGLRVINVGRPDSPWDVGALTTPGYATKVSVAGGYAYLAAGSAGLHVIDITQPATPVLIATVLTTYAQDVRVKGSCAYVADGTGGFLLVDISDPLNAAITGWAETDGSSNGVYGSGDFAYVADSNGLQVITLIDPTYPYLINTVSTPEPVQKVAVSGNYAYVADGAAGLQVIDKSMFSCGDQTPATPGSISYPVSDYDGNFAITWSPATRATGYVLQRAVNSSFTGATTAYRGSASVFNQTGLATGTYYYRVQATDDCGASSWRTGAAIAVSSFPPAPATLSYPPSNCGVAFTVTWSQSPGATSYALQRASDSSFSGATTVYSGPMTWYSQAALAIGAYYYRVQASNTAGASAWKNGGALHVVTTPTAPSTIGYPLTSCDGNFTVTWADVDGAASYTLQRATSLSFAGAASLYTGPLLAFSEKSLTAGTYYYRVRANNDCGASAWKDGDGLVISPAPPAPATISYPATNCGGNFPITWGQVAGATSYTLQRDTAADFKNPTENIVYSTSFTQGSLALGTYFYRVRANTACGSGTWRSGPAISIIGPPSPPASITYPGNSCDGNLTISWQAIAEATSYTLQRATNSSFTDAIPVYTGSATAYPQTSLGPGAYFYRVQANNSCGTSDWETGGATTVTSSPSAPASLTYPASRCGGSFTVTWPVVSGAIGYTLQRATNGSFTGATVVYNGTGNSYSETNLATGSFYYRVSADNNCGSSPWQPGAAINVVAAPTPPATIIYPSSNCSGAFIVSWAAVSGTTTYTLQRATDSAFANATTVYTGTGMSFSQTGLAQGAYYYRAMATNDCGSSSWTPGSAVTVTDTLSPPASITYPSSTCTGAFKVSWDAVAAATSYILQRATSPSFADARDLYVSSATVFDETGLGVGTYYYRVLAKNSCGNSSWLAGPAIMVTTIPGAPGTVTYLSNNCSGSIMVSWPKVDGALTYTLQRASNAAFTDAGQVFSGAAPSFNDTNLPNGIYHYRVLASNDCGSSGWASGAAVTLTAAPAAPVSISYSTTSCNGTVSVTWPTVSAASSYTLQRATSPDFADANIVYSGAANSFDQTGLASGTYYFRVLAANDCGTSNWKGGLAIAVTGIPPAPGSISYPTGVCDGSFMVSWPQAQGATSYTLQRATDAQFANAATAYSGSSFQYGETVPGSGTFYYRVQASNSCGISGWKDGPAITITPSPSTPATITYPAASCTGQFTVSWAAIDGGGATYTLQRSLDASFGNFVIVSSGPTPSYTETGLQQGAFYYRVQATNSCGTGDWKAGGAATIAGFPPPSTPAAITYPASSADGSFTVAWSAAGGATSYTLQRATSASFADAADVYNGTTNSYFESGLASGTYLYRVRANSDCGNSGWQPGDAVLVNTNQPPVLSGPPQGPVTGIVGTAYQFTAQAGNPDGGLVQYRFAWGDGGMSDWSLSASSSHQWSQANTYCVKVQAEDNQGAMSDWSDCAIISVTRLPVVAGPPTGPTTGKVKTSYKFTGQAADPDGDSVQYRFSWGDGKTSLWAASASHYHTWTAANTYCVKVQAADNQGAVSDWSGCANITVSHPPVVAGPPAGPTTGKVNTPYKFTGQATDPDGDPVQYRFSWGDGKTSTWATLLPRPHRWTAPSTYCVKVQAKDDKGVLSAWSGCSNIQITK